MRLLPVSKTVDEARIRLAYQAGCRYRENKLQEVSRKWEAMADLTDLRWSVIGHLQTNKAAGGALRGRVPGAGQPARGRGAGPPPAGRGPRAGCMCRSIPRARPAYGLQPDEAAAFLRQMPAYSGFAGARLMTLALFSAEAERVRQ